MNQEASTSALETLTARERECLRLVFAGLRAKEIGERLGLADATVHNHLASARRKLSLSDSRLAARLLVAEERKDQLVKDWLDETTTIVEAAALALDEATREEGAGGRFTTTDIYRDTARRGDSGPPVGADPLGTSDAGAIAIHDGGLLAKRPDGPGPDLVRPRPSPRTDDRGPDRAESGLSQQSRSQSARQLTALQKALWIGGLTIGLAVLAGGALLALLVSVHALQSFAAGKPLLGR